MALPHSGSWFGLPDFGVTEKIGSFLGTPQTQQGGSNLSSVFAPQASTPQPFVPSTSMYSTVGNNSPQQVFNPPAQPQQTQPSGGGGFSMDLYPGWDETSARADYSATGGPKRPAPGSGQPDYSAEIESIYNPLFSNLQQQSEYVQNTQLPQSLSQLAASTAQLQEDLESKKAASQLQQTRQQETLQTGRLNAMEEAKRNYRAMQQQAHARFGGSGSAGRAASEISQQEFARQAGRTEQVYAQNLQKLTDYGNSVDLWTMQESRRIARESEQAKLEIQSQAQQRLMQINADKNSLDSAKSSARLELVREAQARINNLADARTTALLELNSWKQQQDYILEKNLQSMQQQTPAPTYDNNFFNPTVTTTPESQTIQQPQYTASGRSDEFQILNPFA